MGAPIHGNRERGLLMKLTDIKKSADAKAAEVEAARKHAQQMRELEVHPLLK